ncbi:MAG: ATP-binding protein [Bacteroidales bacterium]
MNDLSLHIIDIIQNSISAGATRITLIVEENIPDDILTIVIEDNGKGMTREIAERLEDPFYTTRTTRRVGMGIPLYKQSALQSGGGLTISSEPGKGCVVKAWFGHSNIDRPPLGNVANSFVLMVSANPDIHFILRYIFNGNDYVFDSVEVAEVLGDIPLSDVRVIKMLEEMIGENIAELKS